MYSPQLNIKEHRLIEELHSLQEEEKLIEEDIIEADKEKERIDLMEEKFWREYNKYNSELFSLEDDYRRFIS